MSVLKIPALMKLQENLLDKGNQNRRFDKKLGELIIAMQLIDDSYDIPAIKTLKSACEDVQLCVGGYSRNQFLDAIKNMQATPQTIGSNGNQIVK